MQSERAAAIMSAVVPGLSRLPDCLSSWSNVSRSFFPVGVWVPPWFRICWAFSEISFEVWRFVFLAMKVSGFWARTSRKVCTVARLGSSFCWSRLLRLG